MKGLKAIGTLSPHPLTLHSFFSESVGFSRQTDQAPTFQLPGKTYTLSHVFFLRGTVYLYLVSKKKGQQLS